VREQCPVDVGGLDQLQQEQLAEGSHEVYTCALWRPRSAL
jgi:hypothetical protein